MIRLVRVTKTYGHGAMSVRALDTVSLDVGTGECVAVVGASGSGKSTMLHLMAGLDVPDAGSVEVGGQMLNALDDDALTVFRRRKIGVVFQFFNLLPTLDAEENVALPLLLDGGSPREVRPRAERMLDCVGLLDRRRHRPHELSGGQMQRVAIARALVVEPEVILADEPTGNLDSRTGDEILTLLSSTAKRFARTLVMITHDSRAAAYTDRVVMLRDGRFVDSTE